MNNLLDQQSHQVAEMVVDANELNNMMPMNLIII